MEIGLWSFAMTDVDFVPTKPHQPGEFALQWVPRAGHDLARKALGWVSPSTRITSPPTEGRSRYWQRENHSANSWKNASNLALARSLGGRSPSMENSNVSS
ncbi:hypothetical protein Noc_2064 [Nitrosococcus oceani ATCC 19707]|uniref:Uncharacterized protein n=2 Tax=Nitrosococcus oceani TaxID=1229 RepID=Q3J9H2_NITOC|nr:hypothetical protein Noc_2064 [Nitrosococcus oceani ATCC 19707]